MVIEEGARLERATVRGPGHHRARLAASPTPTSARTRRSATTCQIENAELEHSIVLSGSSMSDLEYRIEASLIGKNVRIRRGPALPKAYRFVVGDNADVQIL